MNIPFPIAFTKMSGTGNDFIIIDHRTPFIPKEHAAAFARAVCRRSVSVGADGLILIETAPDVDFAWQFYNADGSTAEMCGNGARCAARFAYEKGIAEKKMRFLTLAGVIHAEIGAGNMVAIALSPPGAPSLNESLFVAGERKKIHFINTGVPHAVHFVDDNTATPVKDWGRELRFHQRFSPAGTNANFAQVTGADSLYVRTYERGVEDETLACGTGATAAAVIAALHGLVTPPVAVRTTGGEMLTIHFGLDYGQEIPIGDLVLEGPANNIYDGSLHPEALLVTE